MFADPGFDKARQIALEMAEMMRRMGPFEPHRLPAEEMEYTAMPKILARVKDRFVDAEEPFEARGEDQAAGAR